MLEHFGASANEDCSSDSTWSSLTSLPLFTRLILPYVLLADAVLVLGYLSSSSRSLACPAAFSTVSSSSTSIYYNMIEVTRDLHTPGPRMRIAMLKAGP